MKNKTNILEKFTATASSYLVAQVKMGSLSKQASNKLVGQEYRNRLDHIDRSLFKLYGLKRNPREKTLEFLKRVPQSNELKTELDRYFK